jgi:hypothetical protein
MELGDRALPCCHNIVIDGSALASVCRRIASVYSAVVSGAPITPTIFGSLQDLLDRELQYEASKDYLEDQAHWTKNLPSGSGQRHRPPEAPGGLPPQDRPRLPSVDRAQPFQT